MTTDMLEEVKIGCKVKNAGLYHVTYCRWCRIWKHVRLLKTDEKLAHNYSATIFCRVLMELGRHLASMIECGDGSSFQNFAIFSLALADLKDVSMFHSFSQDDGESWLSIESIAPRLECGKTITQELIDNCGVHEVMAVCRGTATSSLTKIVMDHARYFFDHKQDLRVRVWSWK